MERRGKVMLRDAIDGDGFVRKKGGEGPAFGNGSSTNGRKREARGFHKKAPAPAWMQKGKEKGGKKSGRAFNITMGHGGKKKKSRSCRIKRLWL